MSMVYLKHGYVKVYNMHTENLLSTLLRDEVDMYVGYTYSRLWPSILFLF